MSDFEERIELVVSQLGGNDPLPTTENNLFEWLKDSRMRDYLGPSFDLKLDVLAAVLSGRSLSDVAREHHVSRAAASQQWRRAKRIFGNPKLPTVDSTS